MKVKCLLLIFCSEFVLSLEAQDQKDLPQQLSIAMAQQAKGTYKGSALKFKAYCKEQPRQMLEAIKTYKSDTSVKVRNMAYVLVNFLAHSTPDSLLRREAVYQLATACSDEDNTIRNSAVHYLQGFKEDDFTFETTLVIGKAFQADPAQSKSLIRLIGYLRIKKQIIALKRLVNDETLSNRIKWDGWLALARMGDVEAIDYVLKMVKTVPIGDDLVFEFGPDLIFTRQHKIFDYLIEILNSNDKNCSSSNPDASGKILCGYRVMEYLAPVIVSYPLQTRASGDIATKDYNTALKTVRDWFKNQNGKYVIKTDAF